MGKNVRSPRTPRGERPERGDATQQKLLAAAIDVFGRRGFDGTTTRVLADAAGVNLQAIPYYFGDKQGLYIAAADAIAALIKTHVSDLRERVRARIEEADANGTPVEANEARALLTEIAQAMAALFVSKESETWARFIVREQMEPTEAFNRLYGNVMRPMLEVAGRLLAIILGEPPGSEHVRLRMLSLLGSIIVFRLANAAAMAQLGWTNLGPRETEVIRRHAAELIAAIKREGQSR
jgi:AcrR family transcriptional regulator